MSERQRKLHELQARLRQSRKANQNAVIAERRREKVCSIFGSPCPFLSHAGNPSMRACAHAIYSALETLCAQTRCPLGALTPNPMYLRTPGQPAINVDRQQDVSNHSSAAVEENAHQHAKHMWHVMADSRPDVSKLKSRNSSLEANSSPRCLYQMHKKKTRLSSKRKWFERKQKQKRQADTVPHCHFCSWATRRRTRTQSASGSRRSRSGRLRSWSGAA